MTFKDFFEKAKAVVYNAMSNWEFLSCMVTILSTCAVLQSTRATLTKLTQLEGRMAMMNYHVQYLYNNAYTEDDDVDYGVDSF